MTSDAPRLDLDDGGLWLSFSEIAELKGVSRQAVAKRVASLVDAGKVETRPGPNGTKLVALAQYDRAIGETGDAFKEAAAQTKAEVGDESANPALRDHQTRAAQYSADLKHLDLQERLGQLVPVAEVADAAQRAAEAIVRSLDRLPSFADQIAAAVGKDGPNGARAVLKEMTREIRQSCADAMAALAAAQTRAPVTDAEPD